MQFEEETSTLLFRSSSTSGEKLWMCCEWCWWIYVCPRPSCRGCLCSDHRVVEMWILFVKCLCRYPVRPLRLPERRLTYVPANSGTPYVPFLAKVMPKFFVNLCMTLLKKGTYGVLRLMHGPGYLSTKLSDVFLIFCCTNFCLFLMKCKHVGRRARPF